MRESLSVAPSLRERNDSGRGIFPPSLLSLSVEFCLDRDPGGHKEQRLKVTSGKADG